MGSTLPQITSKPDILSKSRQRALLWSARKLLDRIVVAGHHEGSPRLEIWPKAPTSRSKKRACELELKPLDRIGSEQGRSGAKVMVARFCKARYPRSRPLIVKLKEPGAGGHDLVDEHKRAIAMYDFLSKEVKWRFALPVHPEGWQRKHQGKRCQVLWTRFMPSQESAETGELGQYDLWKQLTGGQEGKPSGLPPPKTVLREIYGNLLRPFYTTHTGLTETEQRIAREYSDYLRDIWTDKTDAPAWGRLWCRVWGPRNDRHFTDHHGAKRTNPLWLLDQLWCAKKRKLLFGPVHGDLHPRNVVFFDGGTPGFIDFAWSDQSAHVAKDFVLMECNLRFMALEPAIPYNELRLMAECAVCNRTYGGPSGTAASERMALVDTVRGIARDTFLSSAQSDDWLWEYTIPLFLVALGLMKHIKRCNNQMAAQLTVLALSDHIGQALHL